MRKILVVFLLLIVCFSCSQKKSVVKIQTDFESLMGKELPAWKYVQTEEDFKNLHFFKEVYEKNISFLQSPSQIKIPPVVHFIWLGPKPFPRESVENVRSWIAKNPDWTFKFWTDRERALPHPQMELCNLQGLHFHKLKRFFNQSDNFGEKSDLLRYEILYQEGGVYVDHDVKCIQSFAPLNQAYDFYCGMEAPYPTSLSSSVLPTNNVIGSKKGHLLLEKMMNWLEANWDRIEEQYPGRDKDAVLMRISHRTFLVLGEIFKLYSNQLGNIDIALPTYYFNAPKEEQAIFSRHQYAGTWFENESAFEQMVRKRLMMVSKKVNKIILALSLLGGLQLVGILFLVVLIRKLQGVRQ